jgi:hypothetical protein
MKKTIVKYFIDFMGKQESWLNEMAARGLRLVRCGKLTYEFEQCAPGEYQYCVEFVGEKSYANQKDYKRFLEGLGYRVYCKNINLNWSVGKLRFRPWGDGAGKFSASPGTYNREILIVEKKSDGKPFDLHTDTAGISGVFGTLRNAYLCVSAIGIILAGLFAASELTSFNFAWGALSAWYGGVLFAVVGAVGIFFSVKYAYIAKLYRELGKTNE